MACLIGAALISCIGQAGLAQDFEARRRPPGLTVHGQAQVQAAPDRAVVRLGASVQADQAAEAQGQVNKIVRQAVEKIKALGIAEANIQTADLTLAPVYAQEREDRKAREPRVVGYRASNVIQVQVEDLAKLGAVIDAAVASGANRLEDLSFGLKNDTEHRQKALRQAVEEARAKAQAIAAALDVRLEGISEAEEGGVDLVRPQLALARAADGVMSAPTPVQPGQLQVRASVTLRYRIVPKDRGQR